MASVARPDLTLIVPGLFGPVPPPGVDRRVARERLVEGLTLSAFETLLSRGRRSPLEHQFATPEDLCFGVLGYCRPAGSDWPAAAVTRHADIRDGVAGWFLRADPVHLKADMSDLVLFDGDFFDLGLDEARALALAISEHFEQLDWRFEVPHPLRWYLHLKQPPEIRTVPLSAARLQPVKPHLPTGDDAARWRACMNEIQMLLHQCEINDARHSRGEAAINSLWFWGGGALPEPVPAGFDHMFADATLARGLSLLAGIRSGPLPAEGGRGILRQSAGRSVLVVIETGFGPARSSNVDAWREFLEELERNWLVPVKVALDNGALSSFTVVSDCPVRFEVGSTRWWQRLHRPESFALLAQASDGPVQRP